MLLDSSGGGDMPEYIERRHRKARARIIIGIVLIFASILLTAMLMNGVFDHHDGEFLFLFFGLMIGLCFLYFGMC